MIECPPGTYGRALQDLARECWAKLFPSEPAPLLDAGEARRLLIELRDMLPLEGDE